MGKYDYERHIIDDIKEYIENSPEMLPDPKEYDDFVEYWYNILYDEDSITGNGFTWYDTEENCAEYISHNMDLVREAAHEYIFEDAGINLIDYLERNELARYLDCTVRCYLLYGCIEKALEELN